MTEYTIQRNINIIVSNRFMLVYTVIGVGIGGAGGAMGPPNHLTDCWPESPRYSLSTDISQV